MGRLTGIALGHRSNLAIAKSAAIECPREDDDELRSCDKEVGPATAFREAFEDFETPALAGLVLLENR